MYSADDVLIAARLILRELPILLAGEDATVRETFCQEIERLVALGDAGRKVDLLLLQLLDRYSSTSAWIRRYLIGESDEPSDVTRDARRGDEDASTPFRAVNAWLDGQPRRAQLQVAQTYRLLFDINAPRKDSLVIHPFDEDIFEEDDPDAETLDILVQIESDDFIIQDEVQQVLVVPRSGPSRNRVVFTIVPRREGTGTITALLFARGRKIQELILRLQVGESSAHQPPQRSSERGIAVNSAFDLPPLAEGSLHIDVSPRDHGYVMRLRSHGAYQATLALTETKLAELNSRVREQLRKIMRTNGGAYYRQDTHIPAEIHTQSLRELAELGYYLYQELFYSAGSGPDAAELGRRLRTLSQNHRLVISIDAPRFVFPWALLYDHDPLDLTNVDDMGFWGFKHQIEYLPQLRVPDATLKHRMVLSEDLELGFLVNTHIDNLLVHNELPLVVDAHRGQLRNLARTNLSEYQDCSALYEILSARQTPAHILYFFCHASSALAMDIDSSKIILTDGPATLYSMKTRAPIHWPQVRESPLVFLNACATAELSPYLYDGLVPYLMARGARGVIGTEVEIPIHFAAEFAQAFLQRFVKGDQPLGLLLLGLRQHYLREHKNVLGLIYAQHCIGELVIVRQDAASPSSS